jgi:uncharacterized protein
VISAVTGGVLITVRVIPRASRSCIAGTRDGAILVRLSAPPVDGAANAELIALLAKVLDVPKRNISITSGTSARLKQVKVVGITADRAASRLPD